MSTYLSLSKFLANPFDDNVGGAVIQMKRIYPEFTLSEGPVADINRWIAAAEVSTNLHSRSADGRLIDSDVQKGQAFAISFIKNPALCRRTLQFFRNPFEKRSGSDDFFVISAGR